MKYLFYTLLASIFIFTSCSKEKSKKWVILDLNVISTKTGLPVESTVWVEYYYQAQTGASATPQEHTETISLGTTVDGKLYTEVDVSETPEKLYIKVYPNDSEIYPDYPLLKPIWSQELNRTETNTITAEITPNYYRYKPYLHNTSCYNETDTLWLYANHEDNFENITPQIFTGCTDGYVDETMFRNTYMKGGETYFKLRTKKNGVVNSTTIMKTLEHEIINDFTLEY